jgi:hypothetical protein
VYIYAIVYICQINLYNGKAKYDSIYKLFSVGVIHLDNESEKIEK